MTDQEINEAIAEACDVVTKDKWGPLYRTNDGLVRTCPDYCNDLNAMHEAEVATFTTNESKDRYYDTLGLVSETWRFMATARERAEALLHTIGKWRDE